MIHLPLPILVRQVVPALLLLSFSCFAFADYNLTVLVSDANVTFVGLNWSKDNATEPCSATPGVSTGSSGEYVTLMFTGTGVYVNSLLDNMSSIANITLDNRNFRADPIPLAPVCGTLFSETGLSDTMHNLTIKNGGAEQHSLRLANFLVVRTGAAIPAQSSVPSRGGLGTGDKVALGVGLGLGIPGLLTIVWKYCSIYVPRRWLRSRRNSPVHSTNPSIAPPPDVVLPLAPPPPSADNAQTPQVDTRHEQLDQIPADMNEKVDNETLTDLTGKVTKRSTHALAFGAFAAIWQGEYEGALVAIKVPRLHANNMAANKLVKKIQSEYDIWGQTRHRNVLHFLGYSTDPELAPVPCFISPWMEHGTTLDYLEKNPNADILKLLKGLAEGLVYLHQIPILHGDIRGSNVLVTADGEACICDFGLSCLMGAVSASTTLQGSWRWKAPELHFPQHYGFEIDADAMRPACDVWSFAMTALELVSRRPPYIELPKDPGVWSAIFAEHLPKKPDSWPADGALHSLWGICTKCWVFPPSLRPSMRDICPEIMALPAECRPLSTLSEHNLPEPSGDAVNIGSSASAST